MLTRSTILFATTAFTLSGTATSFAADLTIATYGGLYEENLRRCVVEPFEKATGKSVEIVLGGPAQWINQIAANPDKPPIDVMYNSADGSVDAMQKGLVAKITPELVPNVKDLVTEITGIDPNYAALQNTAAMGIIYNKATVPNPPQTWKELVDGTVGGKWTTAIPSINYPISMSVTVWNFAHIYGGGIDDIKPGLAAVKKMQESGNVEFWSDVNQVLNGMQTGEFDIAMYWDGRAWAFIDDGNEDKYGYLSPKPGGVATATFLQVSKNANPLAFDYINASLGKEEQGCMNSAMRYGAANKNAEYLPEVRDQITKVEDMVVPPFAELGAHRSEWIETWNKEIGR